VDGERLRVIFTLSVVGTVAGETTPAEVDEISRQLEQACRRELEWLVEGVTVHGVIETGGAGPEA
jgi:hypothetical protein